MRASEDCPDILLMIVAAVYDSYALVSRLRRGALASAKRLAGLEEKEGKKRRQGKWLEVDFGQLLPSWYNAIKIPVEFGK